MTEADSPESPLRTRRRRAAFHLSVIAIVFAIAALALGALLNRNTPRHDATPIVTAPSGTYDPASLPRTIERRCVVCHGCYDAPCQFRMTSDEGVARGATKLPVYDSSRLSEAPLTRLGIDASSVDEWRKLDFLMSRRLRPTPTGHSLYCTECWRWDERIRYPQTRRCRTPLISASQETSHAPRQRK